MGKFFQVSIGHCISLCCCRKCCCEEDICNEKPCCCRERLVCRGEHSCSDCCKEAFYDCRSECPCLKKICFAKCYSKGCPLCCKCCSDYYQKPFMEKTTCTTTTTIVDPKHNRHVLRSAEPATILKPILIVKKCPDVAIDTSSLYLEEKDLLDLSELENTILNESELNLEEENLEELPTL